MSSSSQLKSKHWGVQSKSEIEKELKIAYDSITRNTSDPGVLSNEEYRQLRKDNDRCEKIAYENIHAQDEDDWDVKVKERVSFCSFDEEAEQYLEVFPELAAKLLKALDAMRDDHDERTEEGEMMQRPTEDEIEYLNTSFNCMADLFQTENIGLDQRISILIKQFREFAANLKSLKYSLDSSMYSVNEILEENTDINTIPLQNRRLLSTMSSLEHISDDFELYWTAMCFTVRRLGELQTYKKLHKMINVMIFNARIVKTVSDDRRRDLEELQRDYDRAKELLLENGIPFQPEKQHSPARSPRLEGKKKKRKTKKKRKKRTLKYSEKSSSYLEDGCDFLRREFFWPWNRDVTVRGTRQGISILLMIIGIGVYIWRFMPGLISITFT